MTLPETLTLNDRSKLISAIALDRRRRLEELTQLRLPVRQYRRAQAAYLKSDGARLFAASKSLGEGASAQEVHELAQRLEPYEAANEAIAFHWHLKSSGRGYRPICELPPRLKAEHYLIKDLLQAAMSNSSHLYDRTGTGCDAAIRDIKNSLEESYDWCWHGDIRDCFQCVSPDALIDCLPVPKAIVRNKLDSRSLTFAKRCNGETTVLSNDPEVGEGLRRSRPSGLLQGSPASNLALATFFEDMPTAVDLHGCFLCVYADNIFLAAKTEAKLRAGVTSVREYLLAHPAGRFRLHDEEYIRPGSSFLFLGWEFVWNENSIELTPAPNVLERMYLKLENAEVADCSRCDGMIAETKKLADGYRGALRLWAENDDWFDCVEERAASFAFAASDVQLAVCRLAEQAHSGKLG